MNFNCLINKFVCTQFVRALLYVDLIFLYLIEWRVCVCACACALFSFFILISSIWGTIPRWKWKRRNVFYYRWPGNVWTKEKKKMRKRGERKRKKNENYELIIRYSVRWSIGSTNGIHLIDFPIWKMKWQINCYTQHIHTLFLTYTNSEMFYSN